MFIGAREWLSGIQSGQDVRAPGKVPGYARFLLRRAREPLILRRSTGFQTGLELVSGLANTLETEDALSRFGNQRSAKDSGMRP